MSLLDRGPDLVLVYPEVVTDDGYGTPIRVPSTTPVEVRGRVQPVAATEVEVSGQQVNTTHRFIARSMPGGAWAKVVWNDREWDVLGEPKRYHDTRTIAHVTVLLAARASESAGLAPAPTGGSGGYSAGY